MDAFYRNKVILITGAAGTVGREVVSQLLPWGPAELRLMDNNETELFFMGENYRSAGCVRAFLGDVRDADKLRLVAKGADIIFHIAAFKHVYLSEYNPLDAVQTNVLGVNNVVFAALRHHVPYVLFTSSDKAVNPTNVMGTSKLLGERIITAANIVNTNQNQVFASVRFGNVLGSRGSVLPIFLEQIRKGGPVTITDAQMTRFIMTVPEAGRLVLEACSLACGGEVFITKMAVVRIVDLARAMIELLAPRYGFDPADLPLAYVGPRPGEKLFEELMTESEVAHSLELPRLFVVLPALRAFYQKIAYNYYNDQDFPKAERAYNSSNEACLHLSAIKRYLVRSGVLEAMGAPPAVKEGQYGLAAEPAALYQVTPKRPVL
ncbi:MAG: polysaccharide biosynthesis protein [Deltaproteobacteria bacterium]|nr:polysaccharide biosynthesis protein [Deltaproteobacteria bacterium]MBM4287014.1 polysaccharide biosynthesis protein [Deltaproteobacteria bacterium]